MRLPSRRVLAIAAAPLVILLVLVSAVQLGFHSRTAHADPDGDFEFTALEQRLVSGFVTYEVSSATVSGATNEPTSYFPRGNDGCPANLSSNIKVNQNCLNVTDANLQGRGQANNETSISQDPFNPNHLIASYNDYRRGDGNCYTAYSLDKGRTWNDTTVPMSFSSGGSKNGFTASREYWQAGGDTSVAWDTKGNAYLSCQVFNRGKGATGNPDTSSGLLVFRSTGNDGASWNFPGRYVAVDANLTGTHGGLPLLDKQLMTVDNHIGSPFQDRIYVTWTEFTPDGSAFIYEAYSNDYGQHFTGRHLVSANTSLCVNTYGAGTTPLTGGSSNCNENQFSQPFTGSDGALYVSWNNFNNAVSGADNRNQVLLAKSVDGGNTFSAPIKVADYYDLPSCAPYQGGNDFGRACVPEKGSSANSYFRATNYPSGAVNPTNSSQVVVTFGSYINAHSNEANGCVPTGFAPDGNNAYTGVKTAGACNNDILVSVSNDGGATFTGTTTDPRTLTSINQDPGQATTDQFWQWAAFTKTGKLAVSYYDRQYGTDETTGFSDVSLSGSGDLANFATSRVTSDSMPAPTQFGGLFFGDYSGLTAVDNAYPLWMDTRDPELFVCTGTGTSTTPPALCAGSAANASFANDQDVFTSALAVPSR